MINYELFSKIRHLKENDGLTCGQIAEKLALDPRTVRKYLAGRYKKRKSASRQSKLDPFKPHMVRFLEIHPYSAIQIFHKLREMGFDGSYSIVKAYVRKIRPPKKRAYLTLCFLPGTAIASRTS